MFGEDYRPLSPIVTSSSLPARGSFRGQSTCSKKLAHAHRSICTKAYKEHKRVMVSGQERMHCASMFWNNLPLPALSKGEQEINFGSSSCGNFSVGGGSVSEGSEDDTSPAWGAIW